MTQAASGSGSTARPQVNVVYGTLAGAQAFVPIAEEKGFFQKYGLDGHVSYAVSATAIAALVSGQVQLVVGGAVDTMQAVAAGTPLEMVAFDQDTNQYALFSQPNIKTIADLRGKTVAIAARGDTSDISLRIAIEGSGLNADRDLAIQPVGNSPARFTALLTGQVDAAVFDQEQFGDEALSQGMSMLMSLKDQNIPYASGGEVVNSTFAKEHPDQVMAMLKALIDGQRFIKDPANRTEALGYLAKDLKRDADDPLVVHIYDVDVGRPYMIAPYPGAINTILDALQSIDASRYGSLTTHQIINPLFMDELRTSGFLQPGEITTPAGGN